MFIPADIAHDGPHGYEPETRDAKRQAFRNIRTGDLDPYRALLERFIREDDDPGVHSADRVIASPDNYPHSIPRFAWWLVINGLTLEPNPSTPEPVTAEAAPAPAVPTREHFDSLVYSRDWAPYRDDLVRFIPQSSFTRWGSTEVDCILGLGYFATRQGSWLTDHTPTPVGDHRRSPFLRQFVDAVTSGRFTLTATTPAQTPAAATPETTPAPASTVIPIGPEHPGWQAFAERLAAVAEEAEMCGEFDRIATALGLPSRKDKLTYDVTVTVEIHRQPGARVTDATVRDAALVALRDEAPKVRMNRVNSERVIA